MQIAKTVKRDQCYGCGDVDFIYYNVGGHRCLECYPTYRLSQQQLSYLKSFNEMLRYDYREFSPDTVEAAIYRLNLTHVESSQWDGEEEEEEEPDPVVVVEPREERHWVEIDLEELWRPDPVPDPVHDPEPEPRPVVRHLWGPDPMEGYEPDPEPEPRPVVVEQQWVEDDLEELWEPEEDEPTEDQHPRRKVSRSLEI